MFLYESELVAYSSTTDMINVVVYEDTERSAFRVKSEKIHNYDPFGDELTYATYWFSGWVTRDTALALADDIILSCEEYWVSSSDDDEDAGNEPYEYLIESVDTEDERFYAR